MKTALFFGRTAAWVFCALLAVGFESAYAPRAFAQQSLNDPSFQPGTGADQPVNAVVLLPDQRILVGGEFTSFNGVSNAYLVRLFPDGSVDQSFNAQGITDGPIYRMETQSDGAVLIGGGFNNLLGVPRQGLGRLSPDGTVDLSFDPMNLFATNEMIYAIGPQKDGRILVSATTPGPPDTTSRIVRLQTNGLPDDTFSCTSLIEGFVHVLLGQPNGAILFGGAILLNGDTSRWGLFQLKSTGELDSGFDAGLVQYSTVFALARKPDGKILAGGTFILPGDSMPRPLAQLDGKEWDRSFTSDFDSISDGDITALLLQTDGKLVAGGSFFGVGGYWRRQIIRLDSAGHVDPCFDPGLGLGGNAVGAVRALSFSTNDSILVGGEFYGCDIAMGQNHLARFLPYNDCDQTRVYFSIEGFVAATFPPGGSMNILEGSDNLQDWESLESITGPYIFFVHHAEEPQKFFRAHQRR